MKTQCGHGLQVARARIVPITIVAMAAALSAVLAAVAPVPRRPQGTALACSYVPTEFEDLIRNATFIGIIETTSVGDGINRQPTLAPPWTATVDVETPIPAASETPTTRAFIRTATPVPSAPVATAAVPRPPAFYAELVGQGATASVIRQVAGDSRSSVEIDYETRRRYELDVRRREGMQGVNSCGLQRAPLYENMTRYLAVLQATDAMYTIRRYPIDGDDVVIDQGYGQLAFFEPTYRRYFGGIAADIQEYGDESGRRYATITAERVPLTRMLAAFRGIRGAPRVIPPETGTAGLAARR